MSPWGKYYLEDVGQYANGVFETWRMTWRIEHISRTWAQVGSIKWHDIASHLDVLARELRLVQETA